MNLLRALFILLLIYFVFRYITRLFAPAQKRENRLDEGREQLYPCPTCGTYNTSAVAFRANGGYYCNRECFNRREK